MKVALQHPSRLARRDDAAVSRERFFCKPASQPSLLLLMKDDGRGG
jgi:hypothetical protein